MRPPHSNSRPLSLLAFSLALGAGFWACSSTHQFGAGDAGDAGAAGQPAAESAGSASAGAGTSNTSGGQPSDGGKSSLGGVPSEGGVGGGNDNPSSCSVPTDCTAPDPILCSRACNDNQCEFAPAGVTFTSGPLTADQRSGGFDASSSPYVFWGETRGTPSGIAIQHLQSDGAAQADPVVYLLPTGTEELERFDAAFDGDKLGLMWNAQLPASNDILTQFVITDVTGKKQGPLTLSQTPSYDKYPKHAYTQLAHPTGDGWLLAEFYGVFPATWRAVQLYPSSPPSSPPFDANTNTLYEPPVCSDSGRVAQNAAVIGSVLYLSGYDCDWYQIQDCPVASILARYDSVTLQPLDPPRLALTVNPVAYASGLLRAPVFGPFAGKLAAFWSEFSTPTEFALGQALFNPDGSVAKSRSVTASKLIPKAFVEVASGRALLFSSRLDESVEPPRYVLEAQLLDEELAPVGAPFPIDGARAEEPSDVRAVLSPNGQRVLLTFRQGQARHRILHPTLCR